MNPALIARMQSPGAKKILALDGGGIRGIAYGEAVMPDELLVLVARSLGLQAGIDSPS